MRKELESDKLEHKKNLEKLKNEFENEKNQFFEKCKSDKSEIETERNALKQLDQTLKQRFSQPTFFSKSTMIIFLFLGNFECEP